MHNEEFSSKPNLDKPTAPFSPPPLDVDRMARTWRFAFRGEAMEYFKIWITNLFLTVITLTLYAPWAKVRRLRYFYGNTYLNRLKFDFTGIPLRIFYGRLIALVLYGIFFAVSQLSAEAYLIIFLLSMVAVPWVIRSSHRFLARNSKYGNGRFYFSASMKSTYWLFFCCICVTVLTLGLCWPLALLWFKRYQINHLHVGQLPLRLHATGSDFFAAILLPSLMFIGVMTVAAVFLGFAFAAGQSSGLFITLAALLYMLGILYLGPLIQGYLFKATWSNVEVGNSRIQTDLDPWKFAWIQVTNSLAIIVSLGLLFAWAKVRMYRYKTESLTVVFFDDPKQLSNIAQQDHHALGEELADIFDLDISL